MRLKLKFHISTLLLFLTTFFPLIAHASTDDFMRSTGKIYVVVGVIVIGFIGLMCFLFYLDKKVTKLENQIKDHVKN